jgi:apolipoprotein D and lipocalin family protein
MKISITIILLTISNNIYASTIKPIQNITINNIQGLWYEIARTYNSYEEDCINPTVEYIKIDNEKFDIINRCLDKNNINKTIEYNGKGELLLNESIQYIKMTYYWIFSDNYFLIYLNKKTSSMVIMSDDKKQLWIMNKRNIISKVELKNILKLINNYIDTSKLIYNNK